MQDKAAVRDDILPVYGVTPFTMLDFPERTACIIWFSGCNMRCGYCHNPQIVKGKGRHDIGSIFSFLEKRKHVLDGVVLSGGEATCYSGLVRFAEKIKKAGYAVKLDTNGTNPDLVAAMIARKRVDYIALDYKAPHGKFKTVTGVDKFGLFSDTLDVLLHQNGVPYEIRTTVHTALLNEIDIAVIIADLEQRGYRGTYYVQNFCGSSNRPILGELPQQKRLLNIERLPKPEGFTLAFRNFDLT